MGKGIESIAALKKKNRISKRESAEAQGESFRRERLTDLRDDLRQNRRFFLSLTLVLQKPENGLGGFREITRAGLLGFGKAHFCREPDCFRFADDVRSPVHSVGDGKVIGLHMLFFADAPKEPFINAHPMGGPANDSEIRRGIGGAEEKASAGFEAAGNRREKSGRVLNMLDHHGRIGQIDRPGRNWAILHQAMVGLVKQTGAAGGIGIGLDTDEVGDVRPNAFLVVRIPKDPATTANIEDGGLVRLPDGRLQKVHENLRVGTIREAIVVGQTAELFVVGWHGGRGKGKDEG